MRSGTAAPRQDKNETRGDTSPHQRRTDRHGARRHADHRRGRYDDEGRARVDAEDPGVGQRIARHRLHDRTGKPERAADHEGGERARNAQREDNLRVLRAAAMHQRVPHHIGAYLARPQGEGRDDHSDKDQRRHRTGGDDAGKAARSHLRHDPDSASPPPVTRPGRTAPR